MKLPIVENAEKYVGLYVVHFGDSTSVGFTADEVAEILESEKYRDVQVYKIHRASPDGTMELKGVPRGTFQLEMGMLFYAKDREAARADYLRLVSLAVVSSPPGRAKVQLAEANGRAVTALIYPAEYDDEFSAWLSANQYTTAGRVEGGVSAVSGYYRCEPEVIERHQLMPHEANPSRTGLELMTNLKQAVQR